MNPALDQLMETYAGYQRARVVLSAVSTGIFDALGPGALTLEDLQETGAAPRPTRMVLDVLTAMGYLEKLDYIYSNAPVAREYLVAGAPGCLGDIIRHHDSLWNAWGSLSRVMRTGRSVDDNELDLPFSEEEQTRHFIQGMQNNARLGLESLLLKFDLNGVTHLLDLGGGPATHSLAFLNKYPQLRITLFDYPDVLAIARENIATAGLQDRFQFRAGDFEKDPLGDGYDFIFVSNIVHSLSDAANRELMAKCAAALTSGGRLAIKDMLVDEKRARNLPNLLFAINMLVQTEAGDSYSAAEVNAWFRAAGLQPLGHEIVLDPRNSILLAVK